MDEWCQAPAFYFANSHVVVGAHEDVPVRPGCEVFDFGTRGGGDGLLGGPGRHAEAGAGTALAPWLVSTDELELSRDADGFLDLTMVVERDGVEVGRDTLVNMAWTFEEMVAYASRHVGPARRCARLRHLRVGLPRGTVGPRCDRAALGPGETVVM